jgi:hypothetical protein
MRAPVVLAAAWLLVACVDATHDADVQALGGEAPGVPRGPLHRPGQPCLTCHGGMGPASRQFSVGGTVVLVRSESAPGVGAQVQIQDITGSFFTATTNEVGNFYVPVETWQPTYPTQVQISLGSLAQQMNTHVGRDGSCAGCHTHPQGPTSPGSVYLAETASDLPEGGP